MRDVAVVTVFDQDGGQPFADCVLLQPDLSGTPAALLAAQFMSLLSYGPR